MPLTTIVYPKPDSVKQADWDVHLDNLCQLSKAASNNKDVYWGNVFRVVPNRKRLYQESANNHLNMAYHSMAGYIQVELKYSLPSSLKKGKKYIITFSMLGKFLGEEIKSDPDIPLPRLSFIVKK